MKRFVVALCAIGFLTVGGLNAQTGSPYYDGDGGRSITLVVYEPMGKDFADSEKWILPLVQGTLNTAFKTYSAITIVDRQNLDRILAQQTESASGNYSDEDYVRIGHLVNAHHILNGTITKIPNGSFMLEFAVSGIDTGKREASYGPVPCSPLALQDLSAVQEASANLLGQLGVKLTGAGKRELTAAANTRQVQAETALSKGIDALKKGTVVEALSYFIQSSSIDPQLTEAVSRVSIVRADISSGNIGVDRRNDIAWRRAWVAQLTECEQYVTNYIKTAPIPAYLVYSTNLEYGNTDYAKETLPITIKEIALLVDDSYQWVAPLAGVVDAVYAGFAATGRAQEWELGSWPRNSVSNARAYGSRTARYETVVELVNEEGVVIGRQNVTLSAGWETGFSDGKTTSSKSDTTTQVRFPSVDANKLTDRLAVRIASLNGMDAEAAAQANSVSIMTKTMYKRQVEAPRSLPELRYAQEQAELEAQLAQEWAEYLKTPQSWYDGQHGGIGARGPAGGIICVEYRTNGKITGFLEAAPASTEFSWHDLDDANNRCRSMTVNGIGGWRMPTIGELRMINANRIGGFSGNYVSSSQSTSGGYYTEYFGGSSFGSGHVRAVRVF